MSIGTGHADSQRYAVSINNQMPFAAEFAAIGWVWPCIRPPPGGRPRWRRPDLLGSDPACRRGVARPAALDVDDATPRWLANHAADASRSYRCHSQVPKAGLNTPANPLFVKRVTVLQNRIFALRQVFSFKCPSTDTAKLKYLMSI